MSDFDFTKPLTDAILRILVRDIAAMDRRRIQAFADHFERRDIMTDGGGIYMQRFYLFGQNPERTGEFSAKETPFSVYLHRFMASDRDDAFHNHPWQSFSIILAGGYHEERMVGYIEGLPADQQNYSVEVERFVPGMTNQLDANTFHRVDLLEDDCWTLFITGTKQQSWGFVDRVSSMFVPWRDRLKSRGIEPKF